MGSRVRSVKRRQKLVSWRGLAQPYNCLVDAARVKPEYVDALEAI
jgi:hypothetical protein